jgi:hypothetical protein
MDDLPGLEDESPLDIDHDDGDDDDNNDDNGTPDAEEATVLGRPKLYHATIYKILLRPDIIEPYKANRGRSRKLKKKQSDHLKVVMDILGQFFNYEQSRIIRKTHEGNAEAPIVSGLYKDAVDLETLTGAAFVAESNRHEPFYGIRKVSIISISRAAHAEHLFFV